MRGGRIVAALRPDRRRRPRSTPWSHRHQTSPTSSSRSSNARTATSSIASATRRRARSRSGSPRTKPADFVPHRCPRRSKRSPSRASSVRAAAWRSARSMHRHRRCAKGAPRPDVSTQEKFKRRAARRQDRSAYTYPASGGSHRRLPWQAVRQARHRPTRSGPRPSSRPAARIVTPARSWRAARPKSRCSRSRSCWRCRASTSSVRYPGSFKTTTDYRAGITDRMPNSRRPREPFIALPDRSGLFAECVSSQAACRFRCAFGCCCQTSAQAAEINAAVTTAMKAALDELVPPFERANGHIVRVATVRRAASPGASAPENRPI